MVADKPVLEVLVNGVRDLGEGVSLDIIGLADLSVDAELAIRSMTGTRLGRVVAIEGSGARAVIEVNGVHWWLSRRDVVQAGGPQRSPWEVDGECEHAESPLGRIHEVVAMRSQRFVRGRSSSSDVPPLRSARSSPLPRGPGCR